MKSFVNILCLMLFLSFSATVWSQGFLERAAKRASQKVEQKAEKRADEKIDEKINEGFDDAEASIEGEKDSETSDVKKKPDRSQAIMAAMMKKEGFSSEPLSIAESYHFSSKINMHYVNLNKNGKVKDEGDVVTYLSPAKKNFAYEFVSGKPQQKDSPAKGVFIMDYLNNATIILSDDNGERTGVVYGLSSFNDSLYTEDYEEDYEEGSDLHYANPDIKKTGRTKNILGYHCEEYVHDTEEEEGAFWITKEVKWKTGDSFSAIFNSAMYSKGVYNGMLMESESRDKETGEVNRMQVTEMNEDADVTFVPGEYQLTNLGTVSFNSDEKE